MHFQIQHVDLIISDTSFQDIITITLGVRKEFHKYVLYNVYLYLTKLVREQNIITIKTMPYKQTKLINMPN